MRTTGLAIPGHVLPSGEIFEILKLLSHWSGPIPSHAAAGLKIRVSAIVPVGLDRYECPKEGPLRVPPQMVEAGIKAE